MFDWIMFDWITSIYNIFFTFFFVLFNLFILYNFVKKVGAILFPDKEIKSEYVMITGCDTGFGHDSAFEFNERNIFVFACCLTAEAVEKFNNDGSFKGRAILMNVTKQEDVMRARKIIEEEIGEKGLCCLLNNAGIFTPGPIEWMSVEDMKKTMEVNLWGAVNVTKVMLPLVKKARGRIVNTTSIAGRASLDALSSYCMSKYAFEAFSDSLRLEMKPWGVSVHIIEPGIHGTKLYDALEKRWWDLWDMQSIETQGQYGKEFVNETIGESNVVKSLLSADPKYVVKAYIHAALSTCPQLRYVVGIDANTVFMAIATLPTAIGDFLNRILIKKIAPAATKNMIVM